MMVALKIWGQHLKGKYFWVHVDNEAVAAVINSGSSREPELQNALREIALIAATNQFVLKARFIPGVTNRVPDWLSRWHQVGACRDFRTFTGDSSLRRVRVWQPLLELDNEW